MELKPGGANQPQEFDPKNGQYVDEGKGTAEQDFYLIKFRGVEPKVFDEQFVQPILFQGNVFPFLQKHPESFLKKGYKLVEVKQASEEEDLYAGTDYHFIIQNEETGETIDKKVDIKLKRGILHSVDEDPPISLKIADLREDESGELRFKKAYFLKDKFDDGKKFDFSRKNTRNYNMTDKYLYTMLVCNDKAYSTDENGNRSPYSLLRMTDINSKEDITNIMSYYIDKENLKKGIDKLLFSDYKKKYPKEKEKTFNDFVEGDIKSMFEIINQFKNVDINNEQALQSLKGILNTVITGSITENVEDIEYKFVPGRGFKFLRLPLNRDPKQNPLGIRLVYRTDSDKKPKIFLEFPSSLLRQKKFGLNVCRVINQPIKQSKKKE